MITNVGIADLQFIQGEGILKTILGSCVGIIVYEPNLKIAGLSHILLPQPVDNRADQPLKYGSIAIPFLFNGLLARGAKKENLLAMIAGGANLFGKKDDSSLRKIGTENIKITKKILKKHKIKILSEETGGDRGRTITFCLDSCKLKVSILSK